MSHTCALLTDGSVACFGLNIRGQIGPAPAVDQIHVLTPTRISGLSQEVAALGSGPSAQHTCAILSDGSVACWGHNDAGQLGIAVTDLDETRFSAQPVTVVW